VGTDAYRFLAREHLIVNQLTELTKSRPEELPDRVEQFLVRLKNAERELQQLKSANLLARIDDLIGTGVDIGPYRLWTFTAPDGVSGNDLRDLVVRAKGAARPDLAVCALGMAVTNGRVSVVAVVNDTAIAHGVTARDILNAAMPAIDGRGGGKDALAQGGGTRVEGIDAAQAAVVEYLRARVA
jgi:alanyl-tRNA synthetase